MSEDKKSFLFSGMFDALQNVQPLQEPRWGKMNFIQMLEHLSDFFDVSSGKKSYDLVTPEEHLPKYMEFLLSEKQFRENTKAPVNIIPDEPFEQRRELSQDAISDLQFSVNNFFEYFRNNSHKTSHPVFGPLDFEEWIQLHHKHVTHHFRQFGILPALT
jgi:hypothetical protein